MLISPRCSTGSGEVGVGAAAGSDRDRMRSVNMGWMRTLWVYDQLTAREYLHFFAGAYRSSPRRFDAHRRPVNMSTLASKPGCPYTCCRGGRASRRGADPSPSRLGCSTNGSGLAPLGECATSCAALAAARLVLVQPHPGRAQRRSSTLVLSQWTDDRETPWRPHMEGRWATGARDRSGRLPRRSPRPRWRLESARHPHAGGTELDRCHRRGGRLLRPDRAASGFASSPWAEP